MSEIDAWEQYKDLQKRAARVIRDLLEDAEGAKERAKKFLYTDCDEDE